MCLTRSGLQNGGCFRRLELHCLLCNKQAWGLACTLKQQALGIVAPGPEGRHHVWGSSLGRGAPDLTSPSSPPPQEPGWVS